MSRGVRDSGHVTLPRCSDSAKDGIGTWFSPPVSCVIHCLMAWRRVLGTEEWGGISCAITRLQFDCSVCVCIKNLEVNQHLVYNLKSAGIFCPREWRRCALLRSSVTGDMSHGAGHVLAGGNWATLGTIGATVLQLWHWGTSIFKESISKHLLHIKRN